MTEDQKLWIVAAKQIDADPEDHEDDELIQPVFDKLKTCGSPDNPHVYEENPDGKNWCTKCGKYGGRYLPE